MHALETLVATAAVRTLVSALHERIEPVTLRVGAGFEAFAASLDVRACSPSDPAIQNTLLIVDFPAGVVKALATETAEFGFVMPTAQIAKPWQRARGWRDDATLELWRAGWSPIALDRVVVPGSESMIEFVIGNARRTPRR